MTQDKIDKNAFIDWLLEKFNIPESKWISFIEEVKIALPDGDYFEKLKAFIEEKWNSPYKPPSDKWLNYHAAQLKNQAGKAKEELDPQIQKIRADRAFSEANSEAQRKAKEETMDVLEKIYGRRPGKERRQPCF